MISTGIAGFYIVKNNTKNVFISYYSKGDSHYKNMIIAWAKNNNFKLKLNDLSTDIKIKSDNESYMKKRMRGQIKKADYFIVFIGENTHKREWVLWEIEQAKKLKKPIIAIKENRKHKSPKGLLGNKATWLYTFSEKTLREALEN